MNRFSGTIGYAVTAEDETNPGVWTTTYIEKSCRGDVLAYKMRWDSSQESINDNISIKNRFSLIADAYMTQNIQCARYLTINGVKWKIIDVSWNYPRITVSIGGEYNG